MKNLLTPVLLSLLGYLMSMISLITYIDVNPWWAIGICLHIFASFLVFKMDIHLLKKVLYMLVPVPLGYFAAIFAYWAFWSALSYFV
ncbi:MAG: hypothetical protein MRZ79_05830 [Bacteroidia bacterium]|nr:hypothetical protein [Bacteroidia bacterium]